MAKNVKKSSNLKIKNVRSINNDNEALRFIKMIVIVTLIFVAFYLITLFINKDTTEDITPTDKTATIQYEEILIGNILNQKEDTYYVLVEDTEDTDARVYEVYLANYKLQTGANRVYYSVLNNLFNSKYIAEELNINNDLSKLKFNGTALLKITNSKIVESYVTNETIINHLTELTKTETE